MEPFAIAAALAGVAVALVVTMRRRSLRSHLAAIETLDGCTIRFDSDLAGFTVEPPRPFPARLEMGFGVFERWASGDPEFDRTIAITGEDRWLTARMNEGVRLTILELARGSGSTVMIMNGLLRIRMHVWARADRVQQMVQLAVLVARSITEEIDVPKEIADNAKHDSIARVRKRCLEIMIRDHLPASKQIAFEMLSDADPEVRLLAARHVGPRAVRVLWELASDFTLSGRVRAVAIAEYVHWETAPDARKGIEALCRGPQPEQVKAAIAKAVALIGGPFERQMIAMLEYGDPVAQLEATKALARIGTIQCVEPLLGLAQRSGAPLEVRALARRTVGQIQSAVRGEAGQLSVVQDEREGELSVAEGGEISLEDDAS
jgi:hypothetical protein